MNSMDSLAGELYSLMKESDERKPKPYDTTAEVVRVEEGTVWVHIDGGIEETPVRKTIDAKKGDKVRIHVANGSAWLTGNESAPPTDDTEAFHATEKANQAQTVADEASLFAMIAKDEAIQAQESARLAQLKADQVEIIARNAEQSAETAQQSAIAASEQASAAERSAINANEAATNALNGLSQVEDVVGTLTWLTEHSTVSTDIIADYDKRYYIKNEDNTFTLVTDSSGKNPSEEGWYELTEAVQNYLLAHLALTNEGLWLINDDNSYKLLLNSDSINILNKNGVSVSNFGSEMSRIGAETNSHAVVKNDGLHIWNGSESAELNEIASFTTNGATIGQSNSSQLMINKKTIQMQDEFNRKYVHFVDLTDETGTLKIEKSKVVTSGYNFIQSDPYPFSSLIPESIRCICGDNEITLDTLGVYYESGKSLGYSYAKVWFYKNAGLFAPPNGSSIIVYYSINGVNKTKTFTGDGESYKFDVVSSQEKLTDTIVINYAKVDNTIPSRVFLNTYQGYLYIAIDMSSGGQEFAQIGDTAFLIYNVGEDAKAFTLGYREETSDVGIFSYCFGNHLKVENPYEVAFGKYNRDEPTSSQMNLFSISYGDENQGKTHFRITNDGEIYIGGLNTNFYDKLYDGGFNPRKYEAANYIEFDLARAIDRLVRYSFIMRSTITLSNISVTNRATDGWYYGDISSRLIEVLGTTIMDSCILSIQPEYETRAGIGFLRTNGGVWHIVSPVSFTYNGTINVYHTLTTPPLYKYN